jgi:hypothetical protein
VGSRVHWIDQQIKKYNYDDKKKGKIQQLASKKK